MTDIKYTAKSEVLEALKVDGFALRLSSDEFRNDKEVVLAAIKTNGGAIYDASEELQDDPEVVLAAYKQNPIALGCASYRLKKLVKDCENEFETIQLLREQIFIETGTRPEVSDAELTREMMTTAGKKLDKLVKKIK